MSCRWGSAAAPPPGARLGAALLVALMAVGCGAVAAQPRTWDDPFAYCAAVGTLDAPDARYTGPPVPDSIARGLRTAFGARPDASLEFFVRGTSWRCMDGKVYACNVGANLPCQGRADTSRAPTPALKAFCSEDAASPFVPMVVTGRETIYEWRCAEGAPVIVRRVTTPDARGFLSNVWFEIPPAR